MGSDLADLIERVTFDMPLAFGAAVVVGAVLAIIGGFRLVELRDRRRQRQLDDAIARRYSVMNERR